MTKGYRQVSLLSFVSQIFEKNINNRSVDHIEKCGPFSIFSMVSGLLNQLQIFQRWHLIEMLGILIGLGLIGLKHLIYLRFATGFGILVSQT